VRHGSIISLTAASVQRLAGCKGLVGATVRARGVELKRYNNLQSL